MSGALPPPNPRPGPEDDPPIGVALEEPLAVLRQENEALGKELLRCYEQLTLVFDITENIATLRDPDAMQNALLRRCGEMLQAGAMFLDQGNGCVGVPVSHSEGRRVTVDPTELQAALAQEIALVREAQRARVPGGDSNAKQGPGGAHVLLAALRQPECPATVIIVLRHASDPPFDSGDVLATESVLGYGGHILANVQMVRHLHQMAVETVRALANAIDAKDNYTSGHSERVGWLARLTGLALGLADAQLEVLEWAGILHDVGKIGVSDAILKKPGTLDQGEFAAMQQHARLSYEVLKPVARLGPVLEAVLYHHENWDGSGYPEGRRGEDIPLLARVIRVVDTFDALTSTRAYRGGFTVARAMRILRAEAGRSTDPHVTRTFIRAFRTYLRGYPADFRLRFAHVTSGSDPAVQPIRPGLGEEHAAASSGVGAPAASSGGEP